MFRFNLFADIALCVKVCVFCPKRYYACCVFYLHFFIRHLYVEYYVCCFCKANCALFVSAILFFFLLKDVYRSVAAFYVYIDIIRLLSISAIKSCRMMTNAENKTHRKFFYFFSILIIKIIIMIHLYY